MRFSVLASTVSAALLLSGCSVLGGLTPTKEEVEGYKVYSISAQHSSQTTMALKENLKQALQLNASSAKISSSIPPQVIPEKAARFELVNPFKNATGLMAMAGQGVTIPRCEGSVLEATSNDNFSDSENTTFFVCLMPHQSGYDMNVYWKFTKVSGGLENLGVQLAQAAIGDSSQFIPRTVGALEGAITKTGLEYSLREAYP